MNTSALSANLLNIRQRLARHPIFVRGHGLPQDDPAFTSEMQELVRLSERLALVIRELRSRSNLLQAQAQGLWKVPPERRWRPAESIRQQDRELQQVLEMAADIQRLVEDLIRRSGLVAEGDVAVNIGELVNKLYQQSHSDGLIGAHPPSYLPYAPGHFEHTAEGATILVFVALRALTHLFKRAKGMSAA
jgi:hypothetical protein